MSKNKYLVSLEQASETFVWIDDNAGFSELGLHYSTYCGFGTGSLILRSALHDWQEQSIPWLMKEAKKLGYDEVFKGVLK